MHFSPLLNMFTQCDVIKKFGATLFATMLQRHVTRYQLYIFVEFITEMEVFVVVFM